MRINNWKAQLPLHLMVLPGLLIIAIYQYGPMFGIIMAFQDYNPVAGFLQSAWVGLDNFRFMLSLPDTANVFWNTVKIAVMNIIGNLLVPLSVALLINDVGKKWFRRGVQTSIYLPHFLSWVIVGGILIDILSPSQGIVNDVLAWLGIESIYFLGDNSWFPFVLVMANVWKKFGFSSIIYLAALAGVNPSLYEAAEIDGAGRWRQLWHITLPGIRPIVVLLMTLSLGNVLNAGFEQVLILYSPQVYASGDVIDTMVYRLGLEDMQYSLAASVGLVKSVLALVLISLSYWLAYRLVNYRIF